MEETVAILGDRQPTLRAWLPVN